MKDRPLVIGFAAETNSAIQNAKIKLKKIKILMQSLLMTYLETILVSRAMRMRLLLSPGQRKE